MKRHELVLIIAALSAVACGPREQGSIATSGAEAASCSIDGKTYGIGVHNPDNLCQVCEPSDFGEWSATSEGMACAPGHSCHRGHCWRQLSASDRYRRMAETLFDPPARSPQHADASFTRR